MEKFYTSQEVASRLRINRRTLYEWRCDGAIRGRRVGRKWLFTEADIQRALEQMTPEAVAAANGEGE